MKNEAGKGDRNRITNFAKYRKNYIQIFGEKCPQCEGCGYMMVPFGGKYMAQVTCDVCKGKGKIYDINTLEDYYEYKTENKRNS